MDHKPGQVSHQEWCHSWEPETLYLCKIENISKSTLPWLYLFVVSCNTAFTRMLLMCGHAQGLLQYAMFMKDHICMMSVLSTYWLRVNEKVTIFLGAPILFSEIGFYMASCSYIYIYIYIYIYCMLSWQQRKDERVEL